MKPVFSIMGPGYKIASLFLFLLIGIITASLLKLLVLMATGIGESDGVTIIYVTAFLQSVFVMAMPAYGIAAMINVKPVNYLKMTCNGPMGEKAAFAVLVFIASYILASFLAQWNKGMVLPSPMHEIENVLRSMEDSALETTQLLLSGKTIGSLLLNLFIVAALAAVSEEMFFRGALQQLMLEKYSNGHLAVWISALIFSIIHFQFYGFLPRLLLGAVLGYLFLYMQNLWIPILFHFINNAFIIVLNYGWSDSEWIRQIEKIPVDGWFALAAMVSAVCTFLLFRIFRRRYVGESDSRRVGSQKVK